MKEEVAPRQAVAVEDWKWFGYPGHFVGARECVFHLTTQVGRFLVSTIGDYRPLTNGQRAKKMEEVGFGRNFETEVYLAGQPCRADNCGCGLPQIEGPLLEIAGYKTAGEATKRHMEICRYWAQAAKQNLEEPDGDMYEPE